ncbi:MAG: hypothetical protein IIU47_01375 [Lachnospiraceae bacterium]|nr:hypothetical protein [Lachnospiraceae bacterium]
MKRDKNPKLHTLYLINIIIMCLITLLSLGGILYLTLMGGRFTDRDMEKARKQGREDLLLEMEASFQGGTDTLKVIRDLYPDKIIIDDYGSYSFYPMQDAALNGFTAQDFLKDERGILTYQGDAFSSVRAGIDVNQSTISIDYRKVRDQGLEFVCIYGGRFNSRQEFLPDETFSDHLLRASEAGLDTSLYVTLNARTAEAGADEAESLIEYLKPWKERFDGEIALQVLYPKKEPASDIARLGYTDGLLSACSVLKEAGYSPIVCADSKTFCGLLELARLEDYPRWLQEYGDSPYFPYRFSMWRYGATIMLEGVEGSVFLDLKFE